jgi:hypothetical protein
VKLEKLCLWCSHFYLDTGSPGYSEYTPGSDFTMTCFKHHWEYGYGRFKTEEHYRACLISAQVCPDYSVNQNLVTISPAYK